MLYLSGVRFPTVRPLALYTRAKYVAALNGVVVPRTKLLTKYGLITGFMLFKLFDLIVAMNNMAPKIEWLEYARFQSEFLSYDTIAAFKAAVIIPQVEHVMVFDELYALGMPILLPSPEWSARIVQNSPNHALSLYPTGLPNFGQLPEVVLDDTAWSLYGFEHKPFTVYAQFLSLFEYVYWQGFTNHAGAPHVRRFDSIPDLLFRIVTLDAMSVHRSMMEVNTAWRRDNFDFWRKTAAQHFRPGTKSDLTVGSGG
eukprot:gb/GFBE01074051.1/.p1 GENE.gb/GFBE01074051.1/~~gb/GFBE01074051.1/.p1  ORF type:complete len:255 (+),score=33.80 gb/GFBE01074051.1/:1-765(+)